MHFSRVNILSPLSGIAFSRQKINYSLKHYKTLSTNLRYMYMYVCLHPVLYNFNHKHVGTISCLLEAKDKMK